MLCCLVALLYIQQHLEIWAAWHISFLRYEPQFGPFFFCLRGKWNFEIRVVLQDDAANQHMGPASAEPVSTCFQHSKSDLMHCACSFIISTLHIYLSFCAWYHGAEDNECKGLWWEEEKNDVSRSEARNIRKAWVWCVRAWTGMAVWLQYMYASFVPFYIFFMHW